jgi:hypothetical protein
MCLVYLVASRPSGSPSTRRTAISYVASLADPESMAMNRVQGYEYGGIVAIGHPAFFRAGDPKLERLDLKKRETSFVRAVPDGNLGRTLPSSFFVAP